MLRKLLGLAGGLGVLSGGLLLAANHGVSEVTGLFRATAEETIEALARNVPDEIHDRKTQNELRVARQQVLDRQVELNVSRSQVEALRKQAQELHDSLARRQRLLAEAYPALKQAVEQNEDQVRFANSAFTIAQFQKEVDGLLAQQQRETRQLEIKRDGLTRLEKSLGEGEQALSQMRSALEGLDQELVVLKSRREQAQIEAATLDLVSSATAGHETVASNVGQSVERLKQEVQKLEARNEARQDLATGAQRPDNQLNRAWSRLETLKAYHDQQPAQPAAAQTEQAAEPAVAEEAAGDASHVQRQEATGVVIRIQAADQAAPQKTRRSTGRK